MKQLLALKAEFKQTTGQDYKPGMTPPTNAPSATPHATAPAAAATAASSSAPAGLYEQVSNQGELVRKLKSEKASKVF